MNTTNIKREQISALTDSELDLLVADATLQNLDEDSREDWELYHRIGDMLRSEELAAPMSAGFAARMAARLDAETPHVPVVTKAAPEVAEVQWSGGVLAAMRRYLVPGLAGTAALAVAILLGPQWGANSPVATEAPLAAHAVQTPEETAEAIMPVVMPASESAKNSVSDSQTLVVEDDIVRDPRIDQYLMAHQRFSPSAYSSSQFARSATFAPEADK